MEIKSVLYVPVKLLNDKATTPVYASDKAAGCDLFTTEFHILKPGERKLFKTGLSMAIPSGYYGRIAPRSGLAYKKGIDVLAGVIDEDYRGEIGVILINHGSEDFNVLVGDRIAQMVFERCDRGYFNVVDDLDATVRGVGGYGHTGQ
jgi:dUTP pyrophosphatase